MKKLKTSDSIYVIGKRHFEEGGTQNYLLFQPMCRYLKRVSGVGSNRYIYFWTSKGFFDENITAPTTSDCRLNPELSFLVLKQK